MSGKATRTAEERFWEKVERRGQSECWPWRGHRQRNGYGRFYLGKMQPAHRASLVLSGVVVPPGRFVCHRCDNPPCVNPAHLFVGTNSDNMRDMHRKGRCTQTKLTPAQVIEICARYRKGVVGSGVYMLGREYGVSYGVVRSIITGKRWREITGLLPPPAASKEG